MENLRFNTKALHGPDREKENHNSLRFPVYTGVAFDFESAEDMEDAFLYRKPSHAYSRITNPTVQLFEQTLTLLEDGFGSIALSSGMAAITNALLALVNSKDNIIASKHLFGNTLSLFKDTFKGFGIETRFVDINDKDELENTIDEKSRAVFCETITNPQGNVADFSMISDVAQKYDLPLVVDNTVTTPYLFKAKDFGVDVAIHSTTKYISGGATSVGGAIVDLGNFDWTKNEALKKYHKYGQFAFLARLRKEIYRNFGSCMTPQTAFLQTLGLETLSLRISRSCDNALFLSKFLENNSKIVKVNYPGLESSKFNHLVKLQFKNSAAGGVISFELKGRKEAFYFINNLKLIKRATNINDNKSLVIHPASTIFSDFSDKEKKIMGVTDSLVRLSVGIEDARDLLDDIDQALQN